MSSTYADRYCILGAGSSGLAVAKNFLQQGIPFDCLEREDTIGGNWCYGKPASSVYASTHLISSKRLTEYTDFPMPEEYPEYPGHEQVFAYLQAYARHFDLLPHIQFNTTVERIEPAEKYWNIRLRGGETRVYRGVVIANGHNWDPRYPEFPGEFRGTVLHSSEYKTPDVLTGKRVLVVGGGNSGCDLAVEAANYAVDAMHSIRRGYPILPKFFKGKPIDQCGETLLRWRIPLPMRRLAAKLVVRWLLGPPERVGLPRPDHKLFETHPVINSRLHDQIAHGNLRVKPNVAELAGDVVRFVDGSTERVDVLLYATGFKLSFPFMDAAELNWHDGRPNLYLNIFHPERNNLFCAGLIQPDSGQWGLVDFQAQLIAKYLVAQRINSPAVSRFDKLKKLLVNQWRGQGKYLDTPRHRLEVEHFGYRQELRKLIEQLV